MKMISVQDDQLFTDVYNCQDIYIIPSNQVVIVRMDLDVLPGENEFTSVILKTLK